MTKSVSCIIVAGGRSVRMGADKRRLRLWGDTGPTLLEHMVTLGARYSDDLIVVLNDPEVWPNLAARLIPDDPAGSGPLAGLAAGLAASRYDYALALAGDLPLVRDELLAAMLNYPRPYDALIPTRQADARAPRNRAGVEPLLAIYRRACYTTMRDCLTSGARALMEPLALLDTHYLAPEAWRQHDPQGVSFINLNRPEDVQELLKVEG